MLTHSHLCINTNQMSEINKSIAAMDKILEDLENNVYSTTSDDPDTERGFVTSLVGMETIEYANDYVVLVSGQGN